MQSTTEHSVNKMFLCYSAVPLLVLRCCREWWRAALEQPSKYHDFDEVVGRAVSKNNE